MSQPILRILYIVGDRLIDIYILVITVTAFLSWVPGLYDSKFGRLLRRFTEPFDNLVHRFIPPIMGLDLSPIIEILICMLLRQLWFMVLSTMFMGL
ncbi:YggT family protein [Xylocopilactobacillus apis]|uniref:Cell division protein n=1 Tax=Xylocopilactobacillus apis TaxID=2932183 RepID=A0AAU9D974_9LACO|nr:YggT family protein [Xylocopilactobacillus apis]BDR56220.1 cell division protein [Xylocopilactobacillus apis]